MKITDPNPSGAMGTIVSLARICRESGSTGVMFLPERLREEYGDAVMGLPTKYHTNNEIYLKTD